MLRLQAQQSYPKVDCMSLPDFAALNNRIHGEVESGSNLQGDDKGCMP